VGIEESSAALYGRAFRELSAEQQDEVLAAIQNGDPPGQTWQRLPAKKFFKQLVEQIAAVYYAHPAAWSEIGWGGPASPRGYVRIGYAMRDPWEAVERGQTSSAEIVRRHNTQESAPGAGEATH
jgi:hypothetical protein